MKTNLVLVVILFLSIQTNSFDHSETITKIIDSNMNESPKTLFKIWHLVFGKEYSLESTEAKKRFAIFKANLVEIRKINAQDLPYKLGINQFSDLSQEEFNNLFLTEKAPNDPEVNFLSEVDDDDLTKRNLENNTAIDWRSFYPAVRSQGICGSCWAFSTAGSIDGNRGLKYKKVQEWVSPQQLIDCDLKQFGCGGGYYPSAFEYVQNKGIMLDSMYSYLESQGPCRFKPLAPLVKINGVKFCNNDRSQKCSNSIVYGLLSQGPLSVSVDASGQFQHFKGGIYTATCRNSNHAVNAVGYGVEKNIQYWLIRNSWAATWGEKGYIRIAVNAKNQNSCFVTNRAYLPLV